MKLSLTKVLFNIFIFKAVEVQGQLYAGIKLNNSDKSI